MCISIWPSTTPESVILLSPLTRLRYRTTLTVGDVIRACTIHVCRTTEALCSVTVM